MTSRVLVFGPASFEPLTILWNLINNLSTEAAYPSIRISSIITKSLEGHGIAAAITIHRNLLNQWITLIQTDRCHDLMTEMLNFYEGKSMPHQRAYNKVNYLLIWTIPFLI